MKRDEPTNAQLMYKMMMTNEPNKLNNPKDTNRQNNHPHASTIEFGYDRHTGEPVSLLELYLDFSISQKMMTPVLLPTGIKNNKGRMIKRYELRHRNLLADHQPCDLASQSKVWHACISWFWDHCGHTPGHIVSKCSSLAKYGYSIPCKGLSCGVILYDAVSTQQALWKAFHTNRGTRSNCGK